MTISIYIISGILMLIGVHFTMKYRPYCMLKGTELELAMALYKKKILKEQMSI